MTATYTSDPANNPIDRIRLLVGDTDMSDPLLTDAEISFINLQNNNFYYAAAIAARMIAGKLIRAVQETKFDDVSNKLKDQSAGYMDLAKTLEAQGASISGFNSLGLSAGGISKAEMERVRLDKDREPGFWPDQFAAPPSPGVRK